MFSAVLRSRVCPARLAAARLWTRSRGVGVLSPPRAGQSSEAASEKLNSSIFGEIPVQQEEVKLEAAPESQAPAKVVGGEHGIVMIEGLTAEVPIGAELRIGHSQKGVLVWRHTQEISFALMIGEGLPAISDSVEAASDVTSQNWAFAVSTGVHLRESVVKDVLKSLSGVMDAEQLPGERKTALLNKELDMASRQCIYQPLFMKHKGIDVLTPIGRGQCILLISENRRELTNIAEHMIAAHAHAHDQSSVFTVYACIGRSEEETDAVLSDLREKGLVENCAVVRASKEQNLADRYAAMCTALSIGEHVRDDGGDALVIIDSLEPLPQLWSFIQKSAAEHNRKLGIDNTLKEQELVEVNGTFMAAKTAERRRFFSAVLQRASKASEPLGGGSMTVVPVVKGALASGTKHRELRARLDAIDKDLKLSETLKAKLRARLAAAASPGTLEEESVATFIVEELLSIADGQIVIKDVGENGTAIDPLSSVSRIGARAYPPILEPLASAIRLQLAQATDAMPFQSTAATMSKQDEWIYESEVLKELLVQRSGDLCPLSHQVISLLAAQSKAGKALTKRNVQERLSQILAHFEHHHSDRLRSIDAVGSVGHEDLINFINSILMDIM